MKFSVSVNKFVAVAVIISIVICVNVIISIDKYKRILVASAVDESPARKRRDAEIQRLHSLRERKKWRNAATLKKLDATEDIWLRQSPEQHRALKEMVGR